MTDQQARHMVWAMLEPMANRLPHRFANGAYFNGLRAQCSHCQQPLDANRFHGHLVTLSDNRCVFAALAHCDACGTVEEFHHLLSADDELFSLPLLTYREAVAD